MTDTLKNINIPNNVWTNLYRLAVIPTGKRLLVSNVGTCDVYIAKQAAQPEQDHDAYTLIQRENGLLFDSGVSASGLWVYCQGSAAKLNVTINDSILQEQIDEQEFRVALLVALTSIEDQLRLMNARIEEAYETEIERADI